MPADRCWVLNNDSISCIQCLLNWSLKPETELSFFPFLDNVPHCFSQRSRFWSQSKEEKNIWLLKQFQTLNTHDTWKVRSLCFRQGPNSFHGKRTQRFWVAEDWEDRQMFAGGCCLTDLAVDREKQTNTGRRTYCQQKWAKYHLKIQV